MAGTTSNFSWPYPESSDFVADGATAIENLADAIDTTLNSYKFLQIVQGTYNTAVVNNTNVFADTNLSATITPSSASSKILVNIYHGGLYKTAGNASNGVKLRLMRGAGMVYYDNALLYNLVAQVNTGSYSATYLDSPATTSATTYKTQFANIINAAGVQVNVSIGFGFNYSFIQLIEVAA